MKLPTFFLTLFCFGVTSSFCFGQDCKYPSYAVGFRYYKTTDTSREYITSNDTISRPLLIHLWYPSDDNSDANVMSFKQYIELIAIRDNYSKSEDAIKSEFMIPVKLGYPHSTAMLNTYLHENIDSAILLYRNNKENNSVIYTEDEISNLGRMLLDFDIAASEKLFLLNQEAYSDSWHVYYDLAFVYKLKGETELAKKALAIAETKDPENMDIKNLRQELLQ